MTFASLYAVLVGFAMIGQWTFSLITKQVPEVKTEPFRIAFHLAGEFLTAVALIAGGLGLLTGAPWGRSTYLVSVGMLLYTVIVSPGYFAQKREWPTVGLFAVLLVLALVSLGLVLNAP
jgi:hypothetical protein